MSKRENLGSDCRAPKVQNSVADVRMLGNDELDVVAGAYLAYKLEPCFVKSWSTSGDA
jgi:hypothetical protein